MHGRLISFLDLLAITVAVMVMVLSIVPDKPFTKKPTDWYSFTVELQARSLTDEGTDLTSNLKIGFLLTIKGKQYDIFKQGNAERQFLCDSTGLELTCYFRGEAGENLSGRFFIRDDNFLLKENSIIKASVVLVKIELSIENRVNFKKDDRFQADFTGTLL